jgi:hypothetical protein
MYLQAVVGAQDCKQLPQNRSAVFFGKLANALISVYIAK